MENQEILVERPKKVRHILWGKFTDWLHEASFGKIMRVIGMHFASLTITFMLINPKATGDWALWIMSAKSFFLPKFALVSILVWKGGKLVRWWKKISIRGNSGTLEGIPRSELLAHLFTKESFKRDEIEKKFAISRARYEKLSKKLRRLNVLVKGENNANVLNPDMTRAEVSAIIQGKTKASDLKNILKVFVDGKTETPSKNQLEENLVSLEVGD